MFRQVELEREIEVGGRLRIRRERDPVPEDGGSPEDLGALPAVFLMLLFSMFENLSEFFFLSSEKSKQAGDFFLLFLSLVVLFLLLRSGSRRCVLDPRLFFEASAVVLGRLQTDQRKTKTKSTHGCPVFLHSFCTSRSVRSRPIVTASKERPSPPTRSTSSVS